MTGDEALAQGWSKFLTGMNGHSKVAEMEDCFKWRFKSRLDYYAPGLSNAEKLAAEAWAQQVGEATANYAASETATVEHFLRAAYDIAESSRLSQPAPHAPTKLC